MKVVDEGIDVGVKEIVAPRGWRHKAGRGSSPERSSLPRKSSLVSNRGRAAA